MSVDFFSKKNNPEKQSKFPKKDLLRKAKMDEF